MNKTLVGRISSHWGWVAILLLLMFGFKLAMLDDFQIRKSEINSIRHTGYLDDERYTPAQSVASVVENSQQHAPLYFVLLTVWSQLTSIDPIILRVLSVYFGLLTVAMVYLLVRQLIDRYTGMIAVILLVCSGFFELYVSTIRMYTLLPLMTVVVVWVYWRIVSAPERKHLWNYFWLFLSSLLLLYTHYFSILILIAIGAYHLLFVAKTGVWVRVALVEIATGLAFIPWLPVVLSGFTSRKALGETRLSFIESAYHLFFVQTNGLWWLGLILFGLCLVLYRSLNRSQRYLVLLTAFVLIALLAVNEFTPIIVLNRLRYTTLWTPLIVATLALGLTMLARIRWIVETVLVIWAAMGLWFTLSGTIDHYSSLLVDQIDEYPAYHRLLDLPGQDFPIISLHEWADVPTETLAYYSRLLNNRLLHIVDQVSLDHPLGRIYINRLENYTDRFLFAWLVYDPTRTDLDQVATYQSTVLADYQNCGNWLDEEFYRVDILVPIEAPCAVTEKLMETMVSYDNKNVLSDINFKIEVDQLTVYTTWQTIINGTAISVQVFSGDGIKVAQNDLALTQDLVQDVVLDISQIPAGEYHVEVILYDAVTIDSIGGTIMSSGIRFDRSYDAGTITTTE